MCEHGRPFHPAITGMTPRGTLTGKLVARGKGIRHLHSTLSQGKPDTRGREMHKENLLMATYLSLCGQGRPLFKERNDRNMTTGFERITIKAQKDKAMVFDSLLHHLTADLVRKHLYKMKTDTAVGTDSENLAIAKQSADKWIPERIESIHRKGYRAPPVRRVYIPKPGTRKERPLGIPTVQDRAIQSAVAEILGQIYESDFLNQSFGGRPGIGAHHAVVNFQTEVYKRGTKYVLNLDLENFFGSVDHDWLMKFLRHRIGDPRVLNLIQRWLRAGVIEEKCFNRTSIGVPQGGPVSVLLSNIYLHYALDLWLDRVVRVNLQGNMQFIRYLDDCLVLFDNKRDLDRARIAITKRLEKFSLKLNQEKTTQVSFGRSSGRSHGTVNFLGFAFYGTRSRKGRYKVGIKTEKSRLNRGIQRVKELMRGCRHAPIPLQSKVINRFLLGHYNYYGVGSNGDCLWAMHKQVFLYWRKQLCRRSQKGRYHWSRYLQLLEYFPLCQVKIKLPYSLYSQYQIL